MPCDITTNGTITVFACTRRRNAPRCSCGRPSVTVCSHELTGRKTGQRCDRPLCERCGKSGKCGPHASMAGRVKEGIENHVVVQNNMAIAIAKERDDLRAKLDDLERWRQVTSGEGELPPEGVDVIYRYDDRPRLFLGAPSDDRTYQWRFASSDDAAETTRNNEQEL